MPAENIQGILLDQYIYLQATDLGTLIFISFGLWLLYIRTENFIRVYYTGLIS